MSLVAASASEALFTRSFLHRISMTPSGQLSPGGIADDAQNDVWIGVSAQSKIDKFGPAGEFVEAMSYESADSIFPTSLAINQSSGDFYVTGADAQNASDVPVEAFDSAGVLIKGWGSFGSPIQLAVDNTTGASQGYVYVSHGSFDASATFGGDGLRPGVERFSATGEPVDFTASASYIKGNEIFGVPSENFEAHVGPPEFFTKPAAVAVGNDGSIYSLDKIKGTGVIDKYGSNGLFERTIDGEETPGLGESHEEGGFGGSVRGIAVDPVTDHLLVTVTKSASEDGAVDEFDASGKYLNQIVDGPEGEHLSSAVAISADALGDVSVVDSVQQSVDVFGPGHFLPSLKVSEASGSERAATTLNGAVDPEGQELSECVFEYVTDAAYRANVASHKGQPNEGFTDLSSGGEAGCQPSATSLGKGASYVPVTARIGGLTSGTTYRFRLLAKTSGPLGGTSATTALAFTAPHEASVDSIAATNISTAWAELRAEINPLGAATSYQFEYVDEAGYLPSAENPYVTGGLAPEEPVDIGSGGPSGSADAQVAQPLGGLEPATTYHFRVVVHSEVNGQDSVIFGPDERFSTLPAVPPGLADGRQYELVTPANKGSAEDMFAAPESTFHEFPNKDYGYPAAAAEKLLLETRAAFGANPASGGNAYVFTRNQPVDGNGGEWAMTTLALPSFGVQSLSVPAFAEQDLSSAGIDDNIGSGGSSQPAQRLSMVGPVGGPYLELHHYPALETLQSTRIAGASSGVGSIVLESKDHLMAPGDQNQDEGSEALFEWSGEQEAGEGPPRGKLKLVNVNSEGSLIDRCGAVLGQGQSEGSSRGAVSTNGETVIFTSPDPYAENDGTGCWTGGTTNAPEVYVRKGGMTTEASVADAGISELGKSPTLYPAVYSGASSDGSQVYFVTRSELTADAVEADGAQHYPELYRYDTGAPEGQRVTRASAGEMGTAAAGDVDFVAAVSRDGGVVYFTAFGRLTPTAPAVTGTGVNLYRYDATTSTTTYIATVSTHDYPAVSLADWTLTASGSQTSLSSYANWLSTADGRYLLFATTSALTGYDNSEAQSGDCPEIDALGSPSGRCDEVYRFDAQDDSLACVSCDASGALPVSNAVFEGSRPSSESSASAPLPAISSDGSYAFFESADPLVARDGNGTQDVYEWHDGDVSLISSGQDAAPSYFLGASPDGRDVFIGTHAKLTQADSDTAGDVYDARICQATDPCIQAQREGGLGPCEGEACHQVEPPPIDLTPVSLSFSGAGNVEAPAASPAKHVKKAGRRGRGSGKKSRRRAQKRRKGAGRSPRKRSHARRGK